MRNVPKLAHLSGAAVLWLALLLHYYDILGKYSGRGLHVKMPVLYMGVELFFLIAGIVLTWIFIQIGEELGNK